MDKNFGKELTAKMYSHVEKLSTTETVTSLNKRLKAGEDDSATQEFSQLMIKQRTFLFTRCYQSR